MEKYRSQQEELGKSIKNLESRSSTYSGARFIMFVVAVAALIVGI